MSFKYPFIRAWCEIVRSYPDYMIMEVEKAEKENAPYNAIYKEHETEQWKIVEDITDPETKLRVYEIAEYYRKE